MFSHVILGANDLEKSKQFYDAIFGAMGLGAGVANTTTSGVKRYFYRSDGQLWHHQPHQRRSSKPWQRQHDWFCDAINRAGRCLPCSGRGQRRHNVRRPTRLARGLGWQNVPVLFARPRWQQALRDAQSAESGVKVASKRHKSRC
jgi:catechol 2,3-dioxygenase-like lactoylglutathione lyase family enzyme